MLDVYAKCILSGVNGSLTFQRSAYLRRMQEPAELTVFAVITVTLPLLLPITSPGSAHFE